MSKHLWISLFLLIFSSGAYAQQINWNTPEVVPEQLARENRRVLRFSGVTKEGTQIRVRDNKVKMIFGGKRVRWARIPQKHRSQFPVAAGESGYFSFELYLPTTAVEIPLEVLRNGKWVPYRFSFEVPQEGQAEDFRFIEESFKIRKDEENVKVEDFLSEYDKQEDVGQVVNDRGEWKSWTTGKVMAWASLGFMYYSLTQEVAGVGDDLGTFSGMTFPAWEIGAEYRWNDQWKAEVSYTDRAGEAEADGNYFMQNKDFSWSEFRLLATYYPISFEAREYRWGVKGGIAMHEIPFVVRKGGSPLNPAVGAYRVLGSNTIFLSIGANYETMRTRQWNYDLSAQFLYPVTDDSLSLDSGYGLNASFLLIKEVIPALSMGGKVDFHYIMMEGTHEDQGLLSTSSDITLWQLTPSFIIKAEF